MLIYGELYRYVKRKLAFIKNLKVKSIYVSLEEDTREGDSTEAYGA